MLNHFYPRFDHGHVMVVGDLMLDQYWYGSTARISPEAPVPVVNVGPQDNRPGGAGNVAMNLAALGCAVTLSAIVGEDSAAEHLVSSLSSANVDCQILAQAQHPTVTKLRIISSQQQLLRLDFEERFNTEWSMALLEQVKSQLEGKQLLLISDYKKGSLQHLPELISAARALSIPVLVDPKGSDFGLYKGATLLTPNLSELEAVVGACRNESELVTKGMSLIDTLGLEALLITRSEQGMTLLRREQAALHLPTHAKEVYDVTGAGDTVIATLAAALVAGVELDVAVAMSNVAAGIVISKLGTSSVSAPELRQAWHAQHGSDTGVVSPDRLQQVVSAAKARGEKVVFTNGCFDIIHAGHAGYLEEAKKLGHRLIVAINSDASVKRLKGEARPINPVERRMIVLAAMGAVDWVTWFDGDTPESLLASIEPDILVKGGDYGIDGVVGADIVKAYGGEVKVLSFLDDCSTTAIVNKIRN